VPPVCGYRHAAGHRLYPRVAVRQKRCFKLDGHCKLHGVSSLPDRAYC